MDTAKARALLTAVSAGLREGEPPTAMAKKIDTIIARHMHRARDTRRVEPYRIGTPEKYQAAADLLRTRPDLGADQIGAMVGLAGGRVSELSAGLRDKNGKRISK